MKIELTKEQFGLLLDLVYAGNWVINSTKPEAERISKYDELESYIFSYCDRFDLAEFAEYDEETNEIYPTEQYEESGIMDMLEEYEENVFWDELAQRLAEKDIMAVLEKLADYSTDRVDELINQRVEAYYNEFNENGLDNVEVREMRKLF